MEILELVHCILDTIILAITFLRLTLYGCAFPGLRLYRLVDFSIFLLAFSCLLALGVLDWRREYEKVQHHLIVFTTILVPFAEFLRLFKLLDLLSDSLQKLCIAIVAIGSLIKLLLNFLSIRYLSSLRFGITVLLIVEYIFIAVGCYWLVQKSKPGHLGQSKLQERSYHACIIAVVLLCVAIPGAFLHTWRLSLESQLLISSIWSLHHVFHSKEKRYAREEPPLIVHLENRTPTNQGRSLSHSLTGDMEYSP